MLMIRFQRIGRKNDASFRMAVLEKTAGPKAGKYVDLVGTYNPKTKQITYKADRIQDWIGKGAQVSPSLKNLLIKNGVLTGDTSSKVVSKKNLEKNILKKKAEEEAAAAKAAEEAAKAEAAAAKEAEEAAAKAAEEAAAPAEEAAPEEAPAAEAAPEEAPASDTAAETPEEEKAA